MDLSFPSSTSATSTMRTTPVAASSITLASEEPTSPVVQYRNSGL
jgi:hypothetical protein